MRMAFIGFRHGHIMSLYSLASSHGEVEVVAACEDDQATRDSLCSGGQVRLTHGDYRRMLEEVPCEAVAVGDYYARRGRIIIEALKAGKHVISDKPICTRKEELEQIASLSAEKNLKVGCQLDLRDAGKLRAVRRLIADGAVGQVHTVLFTGQHPLLRASRPAWYFQAGKHGGTINDIAIHAIDAVPWMTGRRFKELVAARVWTARTELCPGFQDGAQMMLRLDNDGGVLGDVSYLAPDAGGYRLPQYWRFTFHGSEGMIEINQAEQGLQLARADDKEPRTLPADENRKGGYLQSFINEVAGRAGEISPTTQEVLEASRIALAVQEAAESGAHNVPL